ncbi:hypothetical protein ACMG5L_23475 [Escherichia coli]|uniref:hypothetical protein n=1 Tax=Escherichia coli TaxID=562 RepID=UPI0039BFAB7F
MIERLPEGYNSRLPAVVKDWNSNDDLRKLMNITYDGLFAIEKLLENAFRYSEQRARDVITKLTWEVSLGEGGLYWTSNACWSISALSPSELNAQLHYVADGIVSQLENRGK